MKNKLICSLLGIFTLCAYAFAAEDNKQMINYEIKLVNQISQGYEGPIMVVAQSSDNGEVIATLNLNQEKERTETIPSSGKKIGFIGIYLLTEKIHYGEGATRNLPVVRNLGTIDLEKLKDNQSIEKNFSFDVKLGQTQTFNVKITKSTEEKDLFDSSEKNVKLEIIISNQ